MTDSNLKWQDIRQRIRQFSKTAAESSNFHLPHFFKFSNFTDSEKLYFLGVLNGQVNFTLLYTEFPKNEPSLNNGTSNSLAWKPCWSTEAYPRSNKPLSREQELLRERMRVRTHGIMSYSITEHINSTDGSKFTQLVFLSGSRLNMFRDNNRDDALPRELTMNSEGCILCPLTCPDDADLICFIQDGDLHMKHVSSLQEVRLTHLRNASVNSLLENTKSAGMPSYIVQEEFDRYVGYWWRPSQRREKSYVGKATQQYQILYEEIDEGSVDILNIVSYETLGSSVDQYRYPRPGTRNATTELKIVEFECADGRIHEVKHLQLEKPLYELFPHMEYLLNAGWLPDGRSIYVEMTNRLQTLKRLFLIPVEYFSSHSENFIEHMETDENRKLCYLLREEAADGLWIHTNELLHILPSPLNDPHSISFLTGSEVSGFLHIHHCTLSLARPTLHPEYQNVYCPSQFYHEAVLTAGDWEVSGKQFWVDERAHLVYFIGFKDTPLETHLYVTSYDHPRSIAEPIRLTELGYSHTIEMDKNRRYFISTFSSVSCPHSCVWYSISIESKSGACVSVVSTRIGTLLNPVTNTLIATAELFEFDSSCKAKFYGMLFKPEENVNESSSSSGNKFPVILNVYGGPHVQHVNNSYTVNRHLIPHKLAHFGFAVVIVDGRGSAHRGNKFEGHLKKKLGNVEIADQVETLQWLGEKHDFLDLTRVAIMGWSYGGYLSLMGIVQRPDVFKVAISGAPVTSWYLYDTAYTERFLGLPCEDLEAYKKSSVVELASKFPDEEGRLMIIHGLMDENVHFYHTSSLVDALVKASKPYILQTYPKERHGIRSPESHEHYVAIVISFLIKNL